ncbi:MAG: hypothetical protein MJ252_00240 [archaeon]|nr:hypothetical protein [archaeon]
MSAPERKLEHIIALATYYYKNRNTDLSFESKAKALIEESYKPFEQNLPSMLKEISISTIVQLAEAAHLQSLDNIAEKLIQIFFELDNTQTLAKNSFYIRALLVKAQIEAAKQKPSETKAEEAIKILTGAVSFIKSAVDIISKSPENKTKYATLLYNASIITINILKNYLKLNWAGNFYEILEKISGLLEENNDVDYNWRIFILLKLAQCYLEADKKAEGQKAIEKIQEVLRKNDGDCIFMDDLYRMRIHLLRDNSGALGNLKKEGESGIAPGKDAKGSTASSGLKYPQFKYIYTIQAIKSGIITEKDFDKEVNTIISEITQNQDYKKPEAATTIKLEHWKADVLAELAFVLLRFDKYLPIAYSLYDFLTKSACNSLKGKLYLENIKSQKIIYDLEGNLKEKVEPEQIIIQKRIEVRAQSLDILDRNMAGCARLQDYNVTNETAMLIFTTAMPFFKRDQRKYFNKAFYTACDQLEQFNSNENYLRAAMHLELAKYYISEDLLQEAKTQILKALNNDYSIPKTKLGGGSNTKTKGKSAPNAKDAGQTEEEISLIDSVTNNVSYLQRNLEQYLNYLKRYVEVKVSVYNTPENIIDKLIFETDNLRNSKNPSVIEKSMNKSIELIKSFEFDEFKLPESKRDFVEEEIEEMKRIHNLKIYDDKKHFINVSSEIAKLCFNQKNYEAVQTINEIISKYTEELSTSKDIDQLIAIGEIKILTAQSYAEYLLDEGIEVCSNNFNNFFENKKYEEKDIQKFTEWRKEVFENIKSANKISSSINQYWLIFNTAKTIWNLLIPFINAPNVFSMMNEDMLSVFQEIFESLNNAMIYYESIGADLTYTDYFIQVELFANISANYAKYLEYLKKTEECINICETTLSRKLESKYRKIFDTIKTRVSKVEDTSGGNTKKKAAPAKAPAAKKGENTGVFVPTEDMNIISECFITLENSSTMTDSKTKMENLKKGLETLQKHKINLNDESTLEIASELYFKYGVQFFSLKTNESYKYAIMCAENCVHYFDRSDISKGKKRISLTLQKYYSLGFLLYADCLLNLINEDKQERRSQIDLYFHAVERIMVSAEIAEKAKLYPVILQNLKAFYSIVINTIDQVQNRILLCKKFEILHDILMRNKAGASVLYSDSEFLLLFYSIFFVCINEKKDWELGEKTVSDCMKIIPNQFHHILLEHKLFYYSKQGKSFIQNLNVNSGGNQNDKDILSKAKLFTKLARNSKNKSDQFMAYKSAIDMLKNDQNVYVANVIFELSVWLYKNNFPYSEVEENLNSAADVLLEIDAVFEGGDDVSDDLHSRKSSSSRRSRLSKKSKSKKSGMSSSKKLSKAGMSKSKMSDRSKSRNYSSHTSKTKTVFAKMLDYDPYPLYLNMNHYEELFKIQVFLGIVSPNLKKKKEYLLDSFYILRKLLEISFKTFNCISFYEKNKDEITSNNFTTEDINPLNTFVSNYFIAKDMNIPQVISLPETLDTLINFEFPEEFLKRIEKENEAEKEIPSAAEGGNISNESLPNYTFFCKKSFESPFQFYYYLNYLLDYFMNEYYFHTECILILKFAILFAKYILENKEIEYAYKMKLSRVIHNIVSNDPKLNGNKISEQIFIKLDESLKEDMPQLTGEIISKEREELRKIDLDLNGVTDTQKKKSNKIIEEIYSIIKELLTKEGPNFDSEKIKENRIYVQKLYLELGANPEDSEKEINILINQYLEKMKKILHLKSETNEENKEESKLNKFKESLERNWNITLRLLYGIMRDLMLPDPSQLAEEKYQIVKKSEIKEEEKGEEKKKKVKKSNEEMKIKRIKESLSIIYQNLNLGVSEEEDPKQLGKKTIEQIFKKMNELLQIDQPKLNEQIEIKDKEELKRIYSDLEANRNNEAHFNPSYIKSEEENDEIVMYCDELKRYRGWMALAEEYYAAGLYHFAKDYCKEIIFHSLVVQDKFTFLKANLILSKIDFLEGNFEESCKKLTKIQTLNENPVIMFEVIKTMLSMFNYAKKFNEMNFFLKNCFDFLEAEYKNKYLKQKFYSSPIILTQMINYVIINKICALVKGRINHLKMKEISIIKEQKAEYDSLLKFYSKEISPLIKQFNSFVDKSSLDIYTLHSLFDYIDNTIRFFIKTNLFTFISKEELGIVCEIFSEILTSLDKISSFISQEQTYIPFRVDNSIAYLPLHSMLAYSKIVYAMINNLIGEFKNRIRQESFKRETLSMDDPETAKKFGEGVKYNQTVIDYLNTLTKEIKRIEMIDKRDDKENINRYEKSISLLVSCENLIPSNSNEYLIYQIEKINSFRLQANYLKELKYIWDKDVIEQIKALSNPPLEEEVKEAPKEETKGKKITKSKENTKDLKEEIKEEKEEIKEEDKPKSPQKKEENKTEIKPFHQQTINLISEFEKNILMDDSYKYIIATHPKDMIKYYFNKIETSGYLNTELTFNSLCDYQNKKVQSYYMDIIPKYLNPKSNDWSAFALENISESSYSFNSNNSDIYSSVSLPDSLKNYKQYLRDIPYYKSALNTSYCQWNDVKQILPNNSSYLILEMNEDRTILYVGFMYTNDSERNFNYFIRRIPIDKETNKLLDDIIFKIRKEKYDLFKTAYPTNKEIETQFNLANESIIKIIQQLETEHPLLKETLRELNEIINPEIPEEEDELANTNAKQKDKAKKAPTGKKDKGNFVSDLPLPTSNIQQITFLIDTRLMDIPFESFEIFSKIPYKSIDFSLDSLISKYKSVNYTPQSGTVIQINGGVRYYLDYSSKQEMKTDLKEIITNHLSGGGGGNKKDQTVSSALEGVLSKEHKPSEAELQKIYIDSNIFIFISQTALLYQMPYDLFDSSKYSKCKVGIIFDRIATQKEFVEEASLSPKTFSLHLQPTDTLALMNLTGLCSILFNRWSLDFNECSELMEDMLEESTSKGVAMSYAINKYKNPKRVLKEEEPQEEHKSKPTTADKKKEDKKGKETKKTSDIVLDETNSIEVKKQKIFTLAPVVFGLNNVKII